MSEYARDDFDDLDGPGEQDGRKSGRQRAVFVDESYDGGGYMGRDSGGRDAFEIPAEPAAAGLRAEPASAGRRDEPDFDFDASKTRRQGGRAAAPPPPPAARMAERPAAPRLERGPGRRDPVDPGPEERRRGGPRPRRSRAAPPEDASGSGGVWAFAVIVSLIWVAGVLAFSVGFFRLPVTPLATLLDAASRLQPHLQLMIGAVAIAPLAVIWSAAFVARRARAVAIEGRRLGAIAARMESAGRATGAEPAAAAVDTGALEDIVERVAERLAQAEERAEIQAEQATRLLENERATLNGLLQDIEAEASRLAQAAATRPPAPPAPHIDIEAIAAAVAARIPAPQPAPAMAPAPSPMRERPTRLAAAPRRADPEPEPERMPAASQEASPGASGRGSARDAMMRAAQAAAATMGQRSEPARAESGRAEIRSAAYDDEDAFDDSDEAFDPEFDADLDDADDDYDVDRAQAAGGLDWNKLVVAANFPENEEDKATLDALLEVIKDKQVADMLQSAEDVLSALADANLFMEDITPHHAPAERWRGYILDGDRRDLIDLGGVRDPHAIEEATNTLHEREGFERTALVFLDRYESLLERLFRESPSNKLAVEMADTRTGRAYMLLARVTGRLG